jgi:CRISPR-associated protein Cas2
MFYVVVYDIPDDPRRGRVARTMEDFGTRVQDSVFECNLTEAQLRVMMNRLDREVNDVEDLLRVYRLCGACERLVMLIGEGTITRDPEVYLV